MAEHTPAPHPNGAGAAAIVAASAGCLAVGVFTLLAEAVPAVKAPLTVWTPSGPLSGVTDGAVLVWLLLWVGLSRFWRDKIVNMTIVGRVSVAMVVAALALTFPLVTELLVEA